jgi:glycosyltransferase involved in cell wall biosynthesis
MYKLSILLACVGNREGLTRLVLKQTIENSGLKNSDIQLLIYDNGMSEEFRSKLFELFFFILNVKFRFIGNGENIGSPQAMNELLKEAKGDYICKIDDDVMMEDNWATKAINAIDNIPNSGLVGFRCVQDLGEEVTIHGIKINVPQKVFTNWVFHRLVFEKVGYFCTLTKYGVWDSDYNYRTKVAGYLNYYIGKSEHLGHDLGVQLTPELQAYREYKTKQLMEAGKLYGKLEDRYKDGYYLTYNQEIK